MHEGDERGPERPAADRPDAPLAGMEQDSRGILDPARYAKRLTLHRYAVGPVFDGLLDRFWTVRWDLPGGVVESPRVLQHPCANIFISHGEAGPDGRPGPLEARVEGVQRKVSSRRLGGTGWCVAAMTTPGGLGAMIPGPASGLTDREVPLGSLLDLDEPELLADLAGLTEDADRVELLAKLLSDVVARADPMRIAVARQVAAVAELVETDRSLRLVGELAAAAGTGIRQLQRMFLEYAGVSPTWVLRRYRLLDAAERVREGDEVNWAAVAAELGYSDQAHLVRDFRGALGTTPAAYARAQRPFAGPTGPANGDRDNTSLTT